MVGGGPKLERLVHSSDLWTTNGLSKQAHKKIIKLHMCVGVCVCVCPLHLCWGFTWRDEGSWKLDDTTSIISSCIYFLWDSKLCTRGGGYSPYYSPRQCLSLSPPWAWVDKWMFQHATHHKHRHWFRQIVQHVIKTLVNLSILTTHDLTFCIRI